MNRKTVLPFITFGFFLSALSARIAVADVQTFAFVSPSQTIAAGAVSEQITIQAQDVSGNESKVPSTACILLSSTSSGGEFSSSAADWSSVTILTMAKNSANRNFYYKDATPGAHTLRGKVVLRPETETRSCQSWPTEEWPSGFDATHEITIGGSAPTPSGAGDTSGASSSGSSSTSQTSAAQGSQGGSSASYTPQIYVSAFVPRQSVAGAPVFFDAEAVGLKKEPLLNARYVWSFGDGGSSEGKKVYHTYHYPASYTVLVGASSGEWSAADRKEIVINASELMIPRVQAGAGGFIEVRNNGASDVDLSYWKLLSSSGVFIIPQGTIVGAKKAIPFPAEITGLLADAESTALLYPNGNVVVAFTEMKTPPPLPRTLPQATAPPAVSAKTPRNTQNTQTVPVPVERKAASVPMSESVAPASSSQASSIGAGRATEALGASLAANTSSVLPWLGGVVLLLLVSLGGYLMMLRPQKEESAGEKLQKEAAEYDIVE